MKLSEPQGLALAPVGHPQDWSVVSCPLPLQSLKGDTEESVVPKASQVHAHFLISPRSPKVYRPEPRASPGMCPDGHTCTRIKPILTFPPCRRSGARPTVGASARGKQTLRASFVLGMVTPVSSVPLSQASDLWLIHRASLHVCWKRSYSLS